MVSINQKLTFIDIYNILHIHIYNYPIPKEYPIMISAVKKHCAIRSYYSTTLCASVAMLTKMSQQKNYFMTHSKLG